MARISRFTQKIFARLRLGGTSVGKFGSFHSGTPEYANNPDEAQEGTAWEQGWEDATGVNDAPTLEDDNAINYTLSQQIAYILQRGIPEYLATERYYIGCYVSSGESIYRSLTDDNIGNAVTDTAHWVPYGVGASAPADALTEADLEALLNSVSYDSTSRILTIGDRAGVTTTIDLEEAVARDPGALTGFADFLSDFPEPNTLASTRALALGVQTVFAAESLTFTIPINVSNTAHTFVVRAFLTEKDGTRYGVTKEVGRTDPIAVTQVGRNELLAIFPNIDVEAGSNIILEITEDDGEIFNAPAISRSDILGIANYQEKEIKLLKVDFNGNRIEAGAGAQHFEEGEVFNVPFKVSYLAKPVESFPKRVSRIPDNLKINEVVTVPESYDSGRTPKRWSDIDTSTLTDFTALSDFNLPNIFTAYGNPSRYSSGASFQSSIKNVLRILLGAITKDCAFTTGYFGTPGRGLYYKTETLTDSTTNFMAPDIMPCRFTGDLDLNADVQASRITEILAEGPYGTVLYYKFDDTGETSTSQPGNNRLSELFGYEQDITDTRFSDAPRTIDAGIYRGTVNGPERTELGADKLDFSPRRVSSIPTELVVGEEFYLTQDDGSNVSGHYRVEDRGAGVTAVVLQSGNLSKEEVDQHLNDVELNGTHLLEFNRVDGTSVEIPFPESESDDDILNNTLSVTLYENLNHDSGLDFSQSEVTYNLSDAIDRFDELHIYLAFFNSTDNERDFYERRVVDTSDISSNGNAVKISVKHNGSALFTRVSPRILRRSTRSPSDTTYVARIEGIMHDSTSETVNLFNTRTQISTGHFQTFNLNQSVALFDEIRFHLSDRDGFHNVYSFDVDDINRGAGNLFALFTIGNRVISLDEGTDDTSLGIITTDIPASDNIFLEYIDGVRYNEGYNVTELLSAEKAISLTTPTILSQNVDEFDELYFRMRFPSGNTYWTIEGVSVQDIQNSIDNSDIKIVLNFGRDNFVNVDFSTLTSFSFSHETGHGITTEVLHAVSGVKYSGAINNRGFVRFTPSRVDRLPNHVIEGNALYVNEEYARSHTPKAFGELTANDTAGFTAKTQFVLNTDLWGNPSRFTEDSDVTTMVYILIAAVEGCTFVEDYFSIDSTLYFRVENLTDGVSHFFAPSQTVCSRTAGNRGRPYPARRITDVVYRLPDGTARHLSYDIPNDETAAHQPGNNNTATFFGYKIDRTDSRFTVASDVVPSELHIGHGREWRPVTFINDTPHIVNRLPSRGRDGRIYYLDETYSVGTSIRRFEDLSLGVLPGFSLAVASDSVWEGTIKSYSTDSDLRVVAQALIGSVLSDCTFASTYAGTATNNIYIREVELGDRTTDFESITVCGVTSSEASPGAARRIEEIIFHRVDETTGDSSLFFYRYDAENDDGSGPTSGYDLVFDDPLITFGTEITHTRGYYRGQGRGIEPIYLSNQYEHDILQALSNLIPNDQPTRFTTGEFGPALTRTGGNIPNRFDSSIVEIGIGRNSGHSGIEGRIYMATDATDETNKFNNTYLRVGAERIQMHTTGTIGGFTNFYRAAETYTGRAINADAIEYVNAQDLTYEHVYLDLQSLGPHWVYSRKQT